MCSPCQKSVQLECHAGETRVTKLSAATVKEVRPNHDILNVVKIAARAAAAAAAANTTAAAAPVADRMRWIDDRRQRGVASRALCTTSERRCCSKGLPQAVSLSKDAVLRKGIGPIPFTGEQEDVDAVDLLLELLRKIAPECPTVQLLKLVAEVIQLLPLLHAIGMQDNIRAAIGFTVSPHLHRTHAVEAHRTIWNRPFVANASGIERHNCRELGILIVGILLTRKCATKECLK